MSHTLQNVSDSTVLTFVLMTVVNYTAGGEPVTAAEFQVSGVDAVFFAVVPASNSLGVPLLAALVGGKVMLLRVTGGVIAEIPTTAGLNATVSALLAFKGA